MTFWYPDAATVRHQSRSQFCKSEQQVVGNAGHGLCLES